MKDLNTFIQQIKNIPKQTTFDDVIMMIEHYYDYTPTQFSNGTKNDFLTNEAGENEGSCKIFSFAQLCGLNKIQTLNCFGKYYREDVLSNPNASNHKNIRNFIKHGWQHIAFDGVALKEKS